MNGQKKPLVGGISLLVVVMVLSMIVFAMLGISTGASLDRMSREAMNSCGNYYNADTKAEMIFAEIRRAYALSEKMPEGVAVENGRYSYSCEISEMQRLYVTVTVGEDGWTVERWRAQSEVEYDDSIDIWDGQITN